jgi:tripartite-type tricarboxylate transporter receptor subunit TctC
MVINLGRRAALAGATALAASPAIAQSSYPDRPIRMIIAFAPVGPTDIVGRFLAPRLTEILGQQIIIDNKPGATGNIGTAMVADAKPDGYTILFSASTMAMAPALYGKQLGYDPVNGLAAIAYVASVPLILVVPADGPKTTAELIDRMRREPDKYSYASSGNGGMIHLASYLFVSRAKAEALHVPYRGSAPGMVDMIAGRHAFQIDTLGTSKGFIDGGKVRVLGVASSACRNCPMCRRSRRARVFRSRSTPGMRPTPRPRRRSRSSTG